MLKVLYKVLGQLLFLKNLTKSKRTLNYKVNNKKNSYQINDSYFFEYFFYEILDSENPAHSNNSLKKEEILRSFIIITLCSSNILHVDVTAF